MTRSHLTMDMCLGYQWRLWTKKRPRTVKTVRSPSVYTIYCDLPSLGFLGTGTLVPSQFTGRPYAIVLYCVTQFFRTAVPAL